MHPTTPTTHSELRNLIEIAEICGDRETARRLARQMINLYLED